MRSPSWEKDFCLKWFASNDKKTVWICKPTLSALTMVLQTLWRVCQKFKVSLCLLNTVCLSHKTSIRSFRLFCSLCVFTAFMISNSLFSPLIALTCRLDRLDPRDVLRRGEFSPFYFSFLWSNYAIGFIFISILFNFNFNFNFCYCNFRVFCC